MSTATLARPSTGTLVQSRDADAYVDRGERISDVISEMVKVRGSFAAGSSEIVFALNRDDLTLDVSDTGLSVHDLREVRVDAICRNSSCRGREATIVASPFASETVRGRLVVTYSLAVA